jgi:prepilin-type N-terminal cleavage/methylation domain-containing protein
LHNKIEEEEKMKKKGFTIIELIVVIVIMGLLMLMAIPAFHTLFAKSRLEEARNDVIGFYQRVNRYAAAEGVDYIIAIDGDLGSFRCVTDTTSCYPKDTLVLCPRLSLTYEGDSASLVFMVQRDGFVKAQNRRFSIYDSDTRKELEFYISPLGVMEVTEK